MQGVRPRRLITVLVVGLLAGCSLKAAQASARVQASAPRAPTRGLLLLGTNAAEAGEAEGGSPQGQVDPLVSNGLGSPSCRAGTATELSSLDRRHCESSGFVASAAPTGNYGIDVHIDTGVLGIGSNWLSSALQDLIVTPVWMALVWAVHALVVMLEWCFTIDLLPGTAAGGLGRGLRQMEASLTQVWLPVSLAAASILAAYHGLVRRRVAETVGEALLMAAMMAGGLWIISNPTGTLGALGGWANEAALGTLAVAAQGSPVRPERTLGSGLDEIFSTAIEGPWCYLEFGDVRWCRQPSRLDPELRAAGLKIAAAELAQIGCDPGSSSIRCVPGGSESAKTLADSAQMLRDGHSNGAVFLALPANGPARNSINEQGSLLRAICQSSVATDCRGSAAAQAQFRTSAQTWSRLGGLLLIAAGMLGMLLLLGSVSLRLLSAALFSLLYLLLAPAVVLAPAFGESGRSLFRRWGMQLIGTVVAKLLFSFLLGVVFALVGLISSLTMLGWWTQWLLMSALWWGAYLRRHQALGVASGGLGREHRERFTIGRRMGEALGARGRVAMENRAERRRARKRAPTVERPPSSPQTTSEGSRRKRGGDGPEPAGSAHGDPRRTPPGEGSQIGPRSPRQAQLERVLGERRRAQAAGETRRAGELTARGARIEAEIEAEQTAAASQTGMGAEAGNGADGARRPTDRSQALPAPAPRPPAPGGRAEPGAGRGSPPDYAALAALAGYSRAQYEQLDPRARREARSRIDRELAMRREGVGGSIAMIKRERPVTDGRAGANAADRPRGSPRTELPRRGRGSESSVMRDAREVEAGRKRQLGLGRP